MKKKTETTVFYVMDIETNTAWMNVDDEFVPAAAWLYLGCLMKSDESFSFFHNWDECRELLKSVPPKSTCFIHNLAYETEYLTRNGFRFDDVIANESHQPIKIHDVDFDIEYRCSYKLLDKSVAEIGEKMGFPKMEYTYDGIRSRDDLTTIDYDYNAQDCRIVVRAIKKELEIYGSIEKLPLTKTGKVRRILRENDDGSLANAAFRAYPTEYLYDMLESSFIGGFAYGSPESFGVILDNVFAADRKSAYPAEMLENVFPFRFSPVIAGPVADERYRANPKLTFIARFHVDRISAVDWRLCMLSFYKVKLVGANPSRTIKKFNGKIEVLDDFEIVADNVTWNLINTIYHVTGVKCLEISFATSVRRLPLPLIRTIAFYAYEKERVGKVKKAFDRQIAAGEKIDENEYIRVCEEYQRAKEFLNSLYGANVQRFRTFEYSIDELGKWDSVLKPYDRPRGLIRSFAWGCYVTAYAKNGLFTGILGKNPLKDVITDEDVHRAAETFVYCDTDSVKSTDKKTFGTYFSKDTIEYLKEVLSKEHFDAIKNFGSFEEEPTYSEFLHIGSKKYFTNVKGRFEYTVAGLPKPNPNKTDEDKPKSFSDVRAGRTFRDVKLARALVDNSVENVDKLFEKTENGFCEYNGPVYGGGGVALFPTSYTINIKPSDAEYIREYTGRRIESFVEPIRIPAELKHRIEYIIEKEIINDGRIARR